MEALDPAELARELLEWSAAKRTSDAASQRSALHWQRQMATEAASLVAVAHDVMTRRQPVRLLMHGPADRNATITSVCSDFLAAETSAGTLLVAPWSGVRGMALEGSARSLASGRADGVEVPAVTLSEVLTLLVEHRPQVRVSYTGSSVCTVGEAFSVGEDVLVIETNGDTKCTRFIALDKIAEVAIF